MKVCTVDGRKMELIEVIEDVPFGHLYRDESGHHHLYSAEGNHHTGKKSASIMQNAEPNEALKGHLETELKEINQESAIVSFVDINGETYCARLGAIAAFSIYADEFHFISMGYRGIKVDEDTFESIKRRWKIYHEKGQNK